MPPPNQAPTAEAGSAQSVLEGSNVTLSGAGSADSDGSIVSYLWVQTSGPAVALMQANTVTAKFDAPLTDTQVSLTFDLTVTDDGGATNTDSATVTVNPSQPPTVSAGPDEEVVEGDDVALAGSASDADGTVATIDWVQTSGPAVTLTAEDTVTPSFTAPTVSSIAVLEFEVTVVDGTGDASSDSVSVTVNPNEPPNLTTIFPCDGCRFYGTTISVRGSVDAGSDNAFVGALDDVASLTVQLEGGAPNVVVPAGGEWAIEDLPVAIDPGAILSITITAEDLFGETTTEAIDLEYLPTHVSVVVAHDRVTPDVMYLFDAGNPRQRLLSVDLSDNTATTIFEAQSDTENLGNVGNAVISPDNTRLLLNEVCGEIKSVDLSSGVVSEISGDTVGSGVAFEEPEFMALDDDDDRLVVADVPASGRDLLGVDITSGDRTVISSNVSIDAGASCPSSLTAPGALAVDSTLDSAILLRPSFSTQPLQSVDLATGTQAAIPWPAGFDIGNDFWIDFDAVRSRAVILSLGAPTDRIYTLDTPGYTSAILSDEPIDTVATRPRQITVDALGDRYVVNDYAAVGSDTDRLVEVDPVTGEYSELYSDHIGTGPFVESGEAVDFDPATGLLYIAIDSPADPTTLRADVATLARETISNDTTGSGPIPGNYRDAVVDVANNRLLALDASRLFAIDLATGDRTVLSSSSVGAGTAFFSALALAPDLVNGRVFVSESSQERIYSVDLATGDRVIVSDLANTGPEGAALGLEFDSANNRLLAVVNGSFDFQRGVVAIDVSTGDKVALSGAGATGAGPDYGFLRDITSLDDGQNVLVNSWEAIYRVDLASGDRVILADSDTGAGESLSVVYRTAYDPSSGLVYAVNGGSDAIIVIDAKTGDRLVIGK